MKILITFLLLVGMALAQDLPNAPSTQMDTTVHNVPNYSLSSSTPRGKGKLLILVGVIGFAVAADAYDIHETERGLKAGISTESNTFLLPSNRPTAGQLWRRDSLVIGLTSTPSILGYIFHKPTLFWGGLPIPAVVGIKHLQGGRDWSKLLQEYHQ